MCCRGKTNIDSQTETIVKVAPIIQDYHALLAQLKESGGKYEDILFPPILESLCRTQDPDDE